MKRHVVTLVTWALPCHDTEVIRELTEDGTLETREEGGVYLIEKAGLREFQEALLLVRQTM